MENAGDNNYNSNFINVSFVLVYKNAKISAVRSLADICFLHVLHVNYLYYSVFCASVFLRTVCKLLNTTSTSFVFILRVCQRLQPTVSFCFILWFRPFQVIRLIDNIFCLCFYNAGSSATSKANLRRDWLDEGEDSHSLVECDLLSIVFAEEFCAGNMCAGVKGRLKSSVRF